jgi:hypothetical protein
MDIQGTHNLAKAQDTERIVRVLSNAIQEQVRRARYRNVRDFCVAVSDVSGEGHMVVMNT